MNHEEKAVAYFGNNFNCSQAVFATFAEELGMDVETALKMANIAEDYQKSLSTEMKTIHSVKAVLGTEIDEVTVEALDSITHTPAVILRKQ